MDRKIWDCSFYAYYYVIIQEMDEIKFESYTRIEHMLTGCWLHALKGMYTVYG